MKSKRKPIMNAVQGRSAAVSAGPAAARSKHCNARASRLVFGSSDALRLVLGAHSRAPGTRQRAIMRIAEAQGSRFKVQGSKFKVQGSKFKVQGSKFKVQGSRFKVQSSRFKVQ